MYANFFWFSVIFKKHYTMSIYAYNATRRRKEDITRSLSRAFLVTRTMTPMTLWRSVMEYTIVFKYLYLYQVINTTILRKYVYVRTRTHILIRDYIILLWNYVIAHLNRRLRWNDGRVHSRHIIRGQLFS